MRSCTLMSVCLSVWMNSLTLDVSYCNNAGSRDAHRDRGSQWERRRAGEQRGKKRWRREDRGGKKGCNRSMFGALLVISPSFVCLAPWFSLLSPWWRAGRGQGCCPRPGQSLSGWDSIPLISPSAQATYWQRASFHPTVRHTSSEVWCCKDSNTPRKYWAVHSERLWWPGMSVHFHLYVLLKTFAPPKFYLQYLQYLLFKICLFP